MKSILLALIILLRALLRNPLLLFGRLITNKHLETILVAEVHAFNPTIRVIIEAGFYDLADTKELRRYFPEARIISLEPNPHLFEEAAKNEICGLDLLMNALVESSKDCKLIEFNYQKYSGSSSLLKPLDRKIFPKIQIKDKLLVQGISIRNIMDKFDLSEIGLLWLDLQGYEINILKDIFQCGIFPTLILCEVSIIPIYKGGGSYHEIDKLMRSRGYTPRITRIPILSGNVLYENKNV
jgi:FkbM family methyltransferase